MIPSTGIYSYEFKREGEVVRQASELSAKLKRMREHGTRERERRKIITVRTN